MIEWRAKRDDVNRSHKWTIYEYPDQAAIRCLRSVASGLTEDDARRIAKLPDLETKVKELQVLVLYARQHLMEAPELGENYTSDEADDLNNAVCDVCCELEQEAAEAAREEAGS